jgi:hypothetical protein
MHDKSGYRTLRVGDWARRALILLMLTSLAPAWSASGEDRVKAGAFLVERPTLQNLGFEWRIEGDANRNASVAVQYREKGTANWITGLPLLRLQGEDTHSRGCLTPGQPPPGARASGPPPAGQPPSGSPPPAAPTAPPPGPPSGPPGGTPICFAGSFNYVAPNVFAGSIFDLKSGTEYEARFTLSDPDGVSGERVKTVTVRTRPEPMPAKDGHVYHVYPFGYTGARQEPSFTGLLQAYYMNANGGDHYNAFPVRVRPGDIILVHAGTYKDDRFHYGHELTSGFRECCTTTGDGTYYLIGKGTPDRPIVIKAAGDGEVIFDGDGNSNLFNVEAADYHYFEGLTIRNTDVAFEAGIKGIVGSRGLTVKRCTIDNIYVGIHTDFEGAQDFYIADNTFTGRHNPDELWSWIGAWTKLPGWATNGRLLSQFAVKVYGSGHVVEYNRVRNFHDGIDHATYGDPLDWPRTPPSAMPSSDDFIGNDISNMHDNCMEADGGAQNIRTIGNLCVNSAQDSFSLQPLLGGPAYFIRNVIYNSPAAGGIKFDEYPSGGVFYNNTWFTNFSPGQPGGASDRAEGSNMHLLNNLILRQVENRPVLGMITWTNYSSSDYNGFFLGSGSSPFRWTSPDFSIVSEIGSPDTTITNASPPLVSRSYETLSEYQAGTHQDVHSMLISYADFVNVKPPDPKAPLTTLYDGSTLDFRLRPGSPEIGKGTVIPNVAESRNGNPPDMGAVPFGEPLPHYGPRPPP